MSKNNVMTEAKALVQQIRANYQEGIDFEFVVPSLISRVDEGFHVKILSPKLKNFCREKFNLPLSGANYNLDYEKGDREGHDFYYRIYTNLDQDILDCAEGKLYRFNDNSEKPRKCKVCGELDSYENGRVVVWDRTRMETRPEANIIAYLHPECSQKYFAGKEQPSENSAQIKEKLLRNLDKLCLDPMGELANAGLLKQKGVEKNFNSGNFESAHDNSKPSYDIHKKFMKEVREVEIEGEKIWLSDYSATSVGSLGYQEVKEALMQEIKQNPAEWEIVNYLDESSWKCDGGQLIIRNKKDGRRHWRAGFYHFWDDRERKRKEWDEIEATLRGCESLPNNQLTPTDKNQLLQYFLTHHITKITLNNGKLVVEYDNSNLAQKVDSTELEKFKGLIQNQPNHSISLSDLKETNSNSPKNPNNHQLAIGLAISAGVVMVMGIIIFLLSRKRKK